MTRLLPILWPYGLLVLIGLLVASRDAMHAGGSDAAGMMAGIPTGLFLASSAAILGLSLALFERHPDRPPAPDRPHPRLDLLAIPWVRSLATSRGFRFAAQLPIAVAFVLIIVAGLFGNPNPSLNIASVLTWTIWWGGLVFLILYLGKAWCYVCPWDAISTWIERMALWNRREGRLGLGMRWPRRWRNIWPATLLFLGFTWIELGFGVTLSPRLTALLALLIFVITFASALVFDRRAFCRYGCLVGRVSGLYALFSGIEVRSIDRGVCRRCPGKECARGSPTAYACPTFEFPGNLKLNTYCTLCTECLQACPEDNLRLSLRPLGQDLMKAGRPRRDEAYLALLMLGMASFHGLTMTPAWQHWAGVLTSGLGGYKLAAFSLGMAFATAAPVAVHAGGVAVCHRVTGDTGFSYRQLFLRYAYALLPIALFYHLAHNLEHLLMEGHSIVSRVSDPLGRGWDLVGTAAWQLSPLLSSGAVWHVQVLLVLLGHVYGLRVCRLASRELLAGSARSRLGQLPVLAAMTVFSLYSLWLLAQPMAMRTSAM